MSVKPILFNTEMIRAILDGRKTCTRRICKTGGVYAVPDMEFYNEKKRTYAVHYFADSEYKEKIETVETCCPICPGDILYVRETWCDDRQFTGEDTPGRYFYKASEGDGFAAKWHPSIHMPKEAARIWLRVTYVGVERLQEIDIEGIRNEGLSSMAVHAGDMEIALKEWEILWNSTIKKSDLDRYGWDANPWVWVVEFERCEKPPECILKGYDKAPDDGSEKCLGYVYDNSDTFLPMCEKCSYQASYENEEEK